MILKSLGEGRFVRIDGLMTKDLTPRNLSADVAVSGLRRVEDIFVERVKVLIEREMGPVFSLRIDPTDRERRISEALIRLMPEIEETAIELITQAYSLSMAEEGFPSTFTPMDNAALQSILSLPQGLVPALRGFDESMRQALEETIREEQARPGFTLDKLVRRLRETTNESVSRLERIARTETTRIANVARATQWEKFADPNRREYEWSVARDDRVDERCRALANGNPWTLPELRKASNGFLPHPRCRCTIVRRPRF